MQEHLIVDGNNSMHAIAEIATELAKDRNHARDTLLRFLEPFAADGFRVTVVFDGRAGRGSLQKRPGIDAYDVVYSSSFEGADGVIERMVMAAKFPEAICVVTNDSLIRNCAYENGASAMRVEEMIKKLDHSISQVSQRAERTSKFPKKQDRPFKNPIPFPDDF